MTKHSTKNYVTKRSDFSDNIDTHRDTITYDKSTKNWQRISNLSNHITEINNFQYYYIKDELLVMLCEIYVLQYCYKPGIGEDVRDVVL